MCDTTPRLTDELHTRLSAAIARRLDAETPADRARAGDELLLVLDEFARRGLEVPTARHADHSALPAPRAGSAPRRDLRFAP